MSKVLFQKRHFFGGLLNMLAISLLVFGVMYVIIENYLLSILFTIIMAFALFILLNKKWFKTISIREDVLIIEFPLNIFGKKQDTISYKEEISEVIHYGYMYRTPSHCKIISKKGKFRFNCTLEEAQKLFEFFKTRNIAVSFNDKKEVGYR